MKVKNVHTCNLHCHALDPLQAEAMGIKDPGKWLPFDFHMGIVVGCKMASDDPEEPVYQCTTLYTEEGNVFIIDTPHAVFRKLFTAYNDENDFEDSSPAPSSPTAEL